MTLMTHLHCPSSFAEAVDDVLNAVMDPNAKKLQEFQKLPGNDVCADCKAAGPEWASYNLGIFICESCSGIHRGMGCHISKVRSLRFDNWTSEQVQMMCDVGNLKAREKYEQRIPLCYKIPDEKDCFALRDQWIRAKYDREEFIYPDKQTYTNGKFECCLMKRGKEDEKYQPRKFVLDEGPDTLVYYIKENKEPKAVIRISELNATFVPSKLGNPNSLQLSYVKSGSTRHIFVYAPDGKVIVDFYLAIRSAKLNRLRVAFPLESENELANKLTRDFLIEGHLYKTGPKPTDSYRKRWFTLDDRKLMYMDSPLAAYAKGEVFLGNSSDGYKVEIDVPPGSRKQGYAFTLYTPGRTYLLSAESLADRDLWISNLRSVIKKPLTPQDNSLARLLVRKKSFNIF